MTDAELLIECKKGLGRPLTPIAAIDGPVLQKLQIVKAFLMGAGVTEEKLESPVAVGAIVCGVTDIWNLEGGNIKFSPLFFILANQLR
jgi:hypothetical protein